MKRNAPRKRQECCRTNRDGTPCKRSRYVLGWWYPERWNCGNHR